jgi:AcrR family transcriptional regulator
MTSDPVTPTRRLSRELVLHEALALLDEIGYDELTMRRLADRLGVVPMAVYRHVANREALVDGILDLAIARVPLPDPTLDWRTALHQLAVAVRTTMLAHPGIVTPLISRPSLGPSSLIIGEYGLGLMRTAGFELEDAERGPIAVLTYTIGFVALEQPRRRVGYPADGSAFPDLDPPYDELPPELFPHTIEIRPRAAEFVSDRQFEYGLEQLLDGIEKRLPRRTRRRSRGA